MDCAHVNTHVRMCACVCHPTDAALIPFADFSSPLLSSPSSPPSLALPLCHSFLAFPQMFRRRRRCSISMDSMRASGGGTAVRPAVKPAFLSPLCRVFLNGVRALSASSLSSSPPYTRPKQGWGRSRAADLSAKESLQNVSGSSRSLFLTRAPEGTSGNDHKEREPVQPSVLRWISSHRRFRGKGKTNFL